MNRGLGTRADAVARRHVRMIPSQKKKTEPQILELRENDCPVD